MQGRPPGRTAFQVVGALAALAVFGGPYCSFAPAAPGAEIPVQYAIVPWVCLGIVVAGAAWPRRSRQDVRHDMGRVFDEVQP